MVWATVCRPIRLSCCVARSYTVALLTVVFDLSHNLLYVSLPLCSPSLPCPPISSPSFSSLSFSSPSNSSPAFSSLSLYSHAISTPATSSVILYSCNFSPLQCCPSICSSANSAIVDFGFRKFSAVNTPRSSIPAVAQLLSEY